MMIGALQVSNIDYFLMKSLTADNQTVVKGKTVRKWNITGILPGDILVV